MLRSPHTHRSAVRGVAVGVTTAALSVGAAITSPAFADGSGTVSAVAGNAGASAVTPGADAQSGHPTVHVNRPGVHVRQEPTADAVILATAPQGLALSDWCQTNRGTTPVGDGTGRFTAWWSMVTLTTGSDFGWVSNLYLDQGGGRLPGVPQCHD